RQVYAGRKILNELDSISTMVIGCRVSGHPNDVARLNGVNLSCTELTCKNRKDPWTGAKVDDDRVAPNNRSKGLGVGIHSNAIPNHRAVPREAVHLRVRS